MRNVDMLYSSGPKDKVQLKGISQSQWLALISHTKNLRNITRTSCCKVYPIVF